MSATKAEDWGEGKTWQDRMPPEHQAKLTAGVDMIGRTGATSIQIRYSGPPDDEPPTVWFVVAEYEGKVYETAAAMDPITAVMRLCERLIDGGECKHCHKPTIFVPDSDGKYLRDLGCVYAYNPTIKKFTRGCGVV